jgi:Fe2+ transport system protein FeoA
MKNILDCKEKELNIIHSFSQDINNDFANDLMDYGLLPGATVIKYPNFSFSDKVILRIGDSIISIRKIDAEKIYIKENSIT